MRHIFICAIAIGALFLSSCTKEQRQSTPQIRHISYAMQGNSMYATKAIQSEDVLQVINATLPTEMNLVLTSQSTNKSTTATSGQGVVLASDTYRVIGYRGGESACSTIIRDDMAYLTYQPSIKVDSELTIVDEVSDYSVPATYDCFCLVCDAENVEKATVTTYYGEEDVDFIKSGNTMVIFAEGNFSSVYLTITLTPVDKERYKTTTYKIATTQKNNISYAEKGKWYLLEPTASGVQPKLIGIDLPTIEQGTL